MALDFPSSPTNGQTYSANNITWVYETSSTTWKVKQDGTAGKIRVATVKDVKPNADSGGQITANTWTTRDLNTISDPSNIGISVNTNVITIPAGTYRIKWKAPGWRIYTYQTKLEYSTDSGFGSGVTKVIGSSEFSSSTSAPSATSSEGVAPSLTFSETTYVRIRQWAGMTGPTGVLNGLGVASYYDVGGTNSGENNIFTVVEIEDLATAVKDNATYVEGNSRVAVLEDQKAENTSGGTSASTTWNIRVLNTKTDPSGFVNFGSGTTGIGGNNTTFSLPAGSYSFQWRAPAWDTPKMRTRLAYSTSSDFSSGVNYVYGESAEASSSPSPTVYAAGKAVVTTTENTHFRIEHYTSNGAATNGLGNPNDITGVNEVYTQIIIEDLATAVKNSESINSTSNVWHVQKTDNQTISGTPAWTDISGLSQTVTSPTATTKFLITATVNASMAGTGHDGLVRLMRGTTVIGSTSSESGSSVNATGFGQVSGQNSQYETNTLAITYLDTPGVGDHIYHIEGRNNDSSVAMVINRRGLNTDFYLVSHMSIQKYTN